MCIISETNLSTDSIDPLKCSIERWHPVYDPGSIEFRRAELNKTRDEYEAVARSYVQVVSLPGTVEMERSRISHGVELVKVNSQPVRTVLDVGCAGARDLSSWMSEGIQYYGIDYSDEMLQIANAHAQNLGCTDAHFTRGNILDMQVVPNSVDMVWCSSVIQHIPHKDLGSVLEKFFRALTPGGILYLNVRPPKDGVPIEGMITSTEYERADGNRHVERFIAHYEINEMIKNLRNCGFIIEKAEQYGEVYEQYNEEKARYLPEKYVTFARKPMTNEAV